MLIRFLLILSLILMGGTLFSQFRVVSNGFPISSTPVTGSDTSYVITLSYFDDLTGNSYSALGVQVGYQILTQRQQLYRIDEVITVGIEEISLKVSELDRNGMDTEGEPFGQSITFMPLASSKIPSIPVRTGASSPELHEAIDTWNARVAFSGSMQGSGEPLTTDNTLTGLGTITTPLRADTTILSTRLFVESEFNKRIEQEYVMVVTSSTSSVVLPVTPNENYPIKVYRNIARNTVSLNGNNSDWSLVGSTLFSNRRPLEVGEVIIVNFIKL